MAKIIPFRAIRPTRDKAHLVATRPVNTYGAHVLKAKLETNPYSFIHIINPDFYETTKLHSNSNKRFERVYVKYKEFLDDNILIQDSEPSIYLYRQTIGSRAFIGVIAGASIEEYNQNKIKKHEATITSRQEMFTDYLDIVGYNAEPVLLSYPHNPKLVQILNNFAKSRAEYEFSTTDRIKHEMWILAESQVKEVQAIFEAIPDLYIADGHHRSASSARLLDRRNQTKNATQNSNYFLSYIIDEQQLNILEFNRVVKGLNGLTLETLLEKLEVNFQLTKLESPEKPRSKHEITLLFNKQWYRLACKQDIIDENHPVNCLDAEILTKFILEPIFGIEDLKTSDRISFIPGNLGIAGVEESINKNQKENIGFFLFPATIQNVIRVADANMIMPPKSTYVEPKMRSGLTIYNINE